MKNEIWKPVKGWEGLYEVSNMGNVRSLDRYYAHCNRSYKGSTLTKYKGKRGGYIVVTLIAGNKSKCAKVHRLVAEAFIPNPDNLPEVNHKNFDKENNTVDNLEWSTRSYNMKHFNESGVKPEYKGANRKSIVVYDKLGNLIGEFEGVREAGRRLNVLSQNISDVLKGKQKTAKGYVFKYSTIKHQ